MKSIIVVEAGNHKRSCCPVSYVLSEDLCEEPVRNVQLFECSTGSRIPCQYSEANGVKSVCWIIGHQNKNEITKYQLIINEEHPGEANKSDVDNVLLSQKNSQIDIRVSGDYFASYYYGNDIAKPYLGPVFMEPQSQITRLEPQTPDHPHHRSIWIAHGDVNGIDTWNEPSGIHGRQIHQNIVQKLDGCVFGIIQACNLWTDFNGNPLLDETRCFTIYSTPNNLRIIDVEIILQASYCKVQLGQTKEAGPLALRVVNSMIADNGGTITNGYGGVNEKECWMKRAPWCDYSGVVNNQQYGVAIFDHIDNENHPTYWHVRNYGLMAPNNYNICGEKIIEPGEKCLFNYRIVFHKDDAKVAEIQEHYHNYANPVQIMKIN